MKARLHALSLAVALAVNLAACTRPNPATCCLDQADCTANGFNEIRECAPGLACVNHECEVPKCSTTGCSADVPVCNITTDVCEGCTASGECSRFASSPVCDPGTGQCVQCVGGSDCSGTTPICDNQTCRGCRIDAECASGACGDDGACVAVTAILYLDPGGVDAGPCTPSAPCRTLTGAVAKSTAARNHIVLAPGAYVQNLRLEPTNTPATKMYIHGGGATLSSASVESSILFLSMPTVVRNLKIDGPPTNAALTLYSGPHELYDIEITAADIGIGAGTFVTARRLHILPTSAGKGVALSGGASLTMEQSVISGGNYGVYAESFGITLNLSNTLVSNANVRALEIPEVAGSISFVTVADSGGDAGTGPRGIACHTNMTVRSSIVWTPGATSRVAIQGCNLVSTIAGPTTTPGAINADPFFMDATNKNYHLAPNSPARDAVDTGPTTDFEGDARPRGARFDIGADEAP